MNLTDLVSKSILGITVVLLCPCVAQSQTCSPFNPSGCSEVFTTSSFGGQGGVPVKSCSTIGFTDVSWITNVTAGTGSAGNGIAFTVLQNTSPSPRAGVVSLQCDQVLVLQCASDDGAQNCNFNFQQPCQVANVPSLKQFAGTNYDHSYITTTRYTTRNSTPVSTTGQMELQNGSTTLHIFLPSAMNNLDGLTSLILGVQGANAVVGGSAPNFYLSVYNTRCEKASCFPRNANLLHLCDGTCATGIDILEPKLMDDYGCAVTAVAMAASHVGVSNIQEKNGPKLFTPEELNDFMSNTIELTDLGGLFDSQGNVDWLNTPAFLKRNTGIHSLQFDGSISLDDALCKQNLPVIVKVTSPHGGPHYVVVTGKQGTATDGSQYNINDPGYDKHTLKDYGNSFIKVGVIKDPEDMSEFNVSVGDEADLLVTDATGHRTGFAPVTGQVTEIPSSAYLRTQVADDITGQTSTGLTHSIQVLTPGEGTYSLTVNGVEPGLYTVTMHFYSQDGSAEPELSVRGIANVGSSSTFQIQFSSTLGAASTLDRVATFQSTLSDITNSLALRLIDNAGIANALSAKIGAASNAAAGGDSATASNVLNSFKNQVNAQTGKHITGIVPQVLREDADSLISQLH